MLRHIFAAGDERKTPLSARESEPGNSGESGDHWSGRTSDSDPSLSVIHPHDKLSPREALIENSQTAIETEASTALEGDVDAVAGARVINAVLSSSAAGDETSEGRPLIGQVSGNPALSLVEEEAITDCRPLKVLSHPRSVTSCPPTQSGGIFLSSVNFISECCSEDAVTIVKIPSFSNADHVPSPDSQIASEVLHIVISDSSEHNPQQYSSSVNPLKSPQSSSKVIPLPVPESISSILASGLAPTTFFDDSWTSAEGQQHQEVESQQGSMGNRVTSANSINNNNATVNNSSTAPDVIDVDGVQDTRSGMSRVPSKSSKVDSRTENVNLQSDEGSGVPWATKNLDNLDNAKNPNRVDIQTRNNVVLDLESTAINNNSHSNLVMENIPAVCDKDESKFSHQVEEVLTSRSVNFSAEELAPEPSCDKTGHLERGSLARETSGGRQITSLHDINIEDDTGPASPPSYATVQQLRAMFAVTPSDEENGEKNENNSSVAMKRSDGHKKWVIENEHSTSNLDTPNDYQKQVPPSPTLAPVGAGADTLGINKSGISQIGEGSSPHGNVLSVDQSKIGDDGQMDKERLPLSDKSNGNHDDNECDANTCNDNDEKVLGDVTITGDKIMDPGVNREKAEETVDSEEDLDNDETQNMQPDLTHNSGPTADPGDCRISANVRIVSKHLENNDHDDDSDGDLGESSDDSSMSSNEYSEETQVLAPSSSLTPFSMSTSTSADAEADHHDDRHLVTNPPGHCLARLDPDHCHLQLSSLPEMYVDDDPSGTLSDVSPISEYDSSIPNMPLETSCDNAPSDNNSGPRADNDIKFNEITQNMDENTNSNMESNHQTSLVNFQLGPNSSKSSSARKDLIRCHRRESQLCRNFESLILIPAI